MKTIRLTLSILVFIILVGGYMYSQFLYLAGGDSMSDLIIQMQRVDTAPVHWLALILFLACIVLSFVKEREDGIG
jgi:hypothetical protein